MFLIDNSEVLVRFVQSGRPVDQGWSDRTVDAFCQLEAIRVLESNSVLLTLARSKLHVTRGRLMVRVREHLAILEALARGDEIASEEEANKHIQSAATDFLDQLRQLRSLG